MTDRLAYYRSRAERNLEKAEKTKGVQESTSFIAIRHALTGIGYTFLASIEASQLPQQTPPTLYELHIDGEKLDVTGKEGDELARAVEKLADSIDRREGNVGL